MKAKLKLACWHCCATEIIKNGLERHAKHIFGVIVSRILIALVSTHWVVHDPAHLELPVVPGWRESCQ
eukprot:6172180-Pleurochrysis_carterae.AAC.1